MNPIKGLFASRKFWLLIIDTALSTFALVGGWYLSPDNMSKVVAVIAIIQPLFIFVIYSITAEDNAERRVSIAKLEAGVHPAQLSEAENEWLVEAVKAARAKAKIK